MSSHAVCNVIVISIMLLADGLCNTAGYNYVVHNITAIAW